MKKITAVLIVLCMVMGVCPVITFAAENTVNAVRTGFFNYNGEWKLTDGDNVLISVGTPGDGWNAASSFTDTDGTVTVQEEITGVEFLSARHALVSFKIPENSDITKDWKVTLSLKVKNVKQVSSGARLAVYGNSIDTAWSTATPITAFGVSGEDSGLENLPLLGLTTRISTGNYSGQSDSNETITLSSMAISEYVKKMAEEGKDEVTFRLAAPNGGIRIFDCNTSNPPVLTVEEGVAANVKIKTVFYDGESIVDTKEDVYGNAFAGENYTYEKTPDATKTIGDDIYLYSKERSSLSVVVAEDGTSEIVIVYEKFSNENIFSGYEIDSEGAWCWFADPRAISYRNEEGTIDVTIIGYIDIHGNIKATQVNNITNKVDDVLIRTNLQPDDHNNPTFIVLPDERIVVFYSRHTDERCFWYRVTREKGDITTFGPEKCLVTAEKTTYPSPFLLSDDPDHLYLCWRGIEWHPTMAQLSLPDEDGNIEFTWGPNQVIRSWAQSSGCRPYAKYTSNGKDTIHVTYTATHPDNVDPNSVYYNAIKFTDFTEGAVKVEIQGITGNTLTTTLPFHVDNKETDPSYVVDDRYVSKRGWVWQIALAEDGYPVIAMVRISSDKTSHDYYYVKWNGEKWVKTFLTNGGGKFHPSNTERCYSGGMSIDVENPNVIYCSKPVAGAFGNIYEIVKYTMSADGTEIVSEEQITRNSLKNNVRPWVIPGTDGKDMRVLWMHGDYYHWMVSKNYPAGYPTAIWADTELPKEEVNLDDCVIKEDYDTIGGAFVSTTETANFVTENSVEGEFTVSANVYLEGKYEGDILDMGNIKISVKNMSTLYGPDKYETRPRVTVTVGDKEYVTTNVYGNSDDWKYYSTGTSGDYYFTKYQGFINHTISYDGEYLTLYRDGLIDLKEKIKLEGIEKVTVGGFDGYLENVYVYDRALNHDEIRELCSAEYEVKDPDVAGEDEITIKFVNVDGEGIRADEVIILRPGTDTYVLKPEKIIVVDKTAYVINEKLSDDTFDKNTMSATLVYEKMVAKGANLVPDGSFEDKDGNFSWGTWQTPRADGGYENKYFKDRCEDWFYKVNRDTDESVLYTNALKADDYALGTRWNDAAAGTCSMANFIPVKKGKTYFVSYDYKNTADGVAADTIRTTFQTSKTFDASDGTDNNIPVSVTTTWQTNNFTITAPEDGFIYFHFYRLGSGGSTNTGGNAGTGPYWYFDNFEVFQLEKEVIKASVTSKTNSGTVLRVENLSADDAEDIKVIVASYNENNEVIKAEVKKVTVKANDYEELTFSIGGNIRAYIWEKSLEPLFDEIVLN